MPDVAEDGGHHDHWALPAAVRPPEHAAEFRGDLIERQWQEVGKLNERHRPLSGECSADAGADDRRFGQRRVQHATGELGAQAARDAEDVSLRVFDVLADEDDSRVGPQSLMQRAVESFAHRQSWLRFVAEIFGARHE